MQVRDRHQGWQSSDICFASPKTPEPVFTAVRGCTIIDVGRADHGRKSGLMANMHKYIVCRLGQSFSGSPSPMFPSKALWDVVSQPFKRSQHGLFQGKMKQYGNNVPFSKHKTRRTWLPNVQHKRLQSEIMGDLVRVKLTTRALKTIKKVRERWLFSYNCIWHFS